jgi:hypothetical protein
MKIQTTTTTTAESSSKQWISGVKRFEWCDSAMDLVFCWAFCVDTLVSKED